MKVFHELPDSEITAVLEDKSIKSMRAVMKRLGLNVKSSSASTKLKIFAAKYEIDVSRFKAGTRNQNLIGLRFGTLAIISESSMTTSKQRSWLCVCDCGKQVTDTTAALNSGQRHHCGCQSYFKGSRSRCWRGYGEISSGLWYRIKRNAALRGISLCVSGEQIWQLFLKQSGKCALTGVELTLISRSETASLDRIDSTRGYIDGNIQWVHKTINLMKNALPECELIEWARKIVAYGQAQRQSFGTEQALASDK